MDVHFSVALNLINMGKYEKAVENLETAIKAESDSGNDGSAMECTCVLGELLANMGETDRAREEFKKVLDYCSSTKSHPKQQKIAQEFIDKFDGNTPAGKLKKSEAAKRKPNTTQSAKFVQ